MFPKLIEMATFFFQNNVFKTSKRKEIVKKNVSIVDHFLNSFFPTEKNLRLSYP